MMSPRVTQMSPAVRSPKCSRLRSICRSVGRQVAGDRPRVLGLVDRFLDLVAERLLAVLAEDQGAHAAPQARAAFVVPRRHQSVALIGIGDAEAGKRADLAAFHVGGLGVVDDGRSRAGAAFRGRADASHASSTGIAFSAASALAHAAREDDVAEHQFRTVAVGIFQARLLRPAGRRGRWSACPCRAIGR